MRPARTILSLLLLLAAAGGCGSAPVRAVAARPAHAASSRAAHASRPVSVVSERPALGEARAGAAPVRLFFVGASITTGAGASSAAHAYPQVVAAQLAAAGHPVQTHVMARSGITVATADTWDVAVPSDVVIVQLATNDFMHDEPLATFSATYNDVVRRVRAASPTAQLICLGGWNDPASVNPIGVSAADYDAAAWSACTIAGGRYVDLSAIYMDARNHGPVGRATFLGPGDHFHPNDRGHEELAARVLASQDLSYVPPQGASDDAAVPTPRGAGAQLVS